ncbi:MAG: hypothetical protein R3F07_15495 [Opitutaceae bacterium]
MYSGDPEPANDLKLVINKKRDHPGLNCEVVSQASRWLKSELKGADIEFTYLSCDERSHYGYSMFLVNQSSHGHRMTLSIKIAEINEAAQAFCEIRVDDEKKTSAFPLITGIADDKGRQLLMHYIADFVLSGS